MPDEKLDGLNVSRETIDRLRGFESLVRKWTKRINLIAPATVNDIWARHIMDSLQIAGLSNKPEAWLDLGSGGGFPGIVIAIALQEKCPKATVTLVESDARKSVFLKTVIRELDLTVRVLTERVEKLHPQNATTISARALAGLDKLLDYAERHLDPAGTALFMKGANWKTEVEDAKDSWFFDYDMIQSVTEDSAAILRLTNIKRKA